MLDESNEYVSAKYCSNEPVKLVLECDELAIIVKLYLLFEHATIASVGALTE